VTHASVDASTMCSVSAESSAAIRCAELAIFFLIAGTSLVGASIVGTDLAGMDRAGMGLAEASTDVLAVICGRMSIQEIGRLARVMRHARHATRQALNAQLLHDAELLTAGRRLTEMGVLGAHPGVEWLDEMGWMVGRGDWVFHEHVFGRAWALSGPLADAPVVSDDPRVVAASLRRLAESSGCPRRAVANAVHPERRRSPTQLWCEVDHAVHTMLTFPNPDSMVMAAARAVYMMVSSQPDQKVYDAMHDVYIPTMSRGRSAAELSALKCALCQLNVVARWREILRRDTDAYSVYLSDAEIEAALEAQRTDDDAVDRALLVAKNRCRDDTWRASFHRQSSNV
jgi:hypothetical protein